MQVDTINPTLNAPDIKRLKPKYDTLLSTFAFKSNLRRYMLVPPALFNNLTAEYLAGDYTRPLFSAT